VDPLFVLLLWILAAAVFVALIAIGVRLGTGGRAYDDPLHPNNIARTMATIPTDPKAKSRAEELAANRDRPGRWKVVGVDRATKMDTTFHTNADSEANARVKAELEGIVVTTVEYLGP
jgi:hypothetical protein